MSKLTWLLVLGMAAGFGADATALWLGDAAPMTTVKMKGVDGRELSAYFLCLAEKPGRFFDRKGHRVRTIR